MLILIDVSRQHARELLLACQGLGSPVPQRPARKADVLAAIRRMRLLQIDTISVVARSPYLVLYSRIGEYEQKWLDELLAEGKLVECWAHAACFVPVEDYPLLASLIVHGNPHRTGGLTRWYKWGAEHKREVKHVRDRIRREGALKSSDFVNATKRGTWWDWKVEKIALEYLLVTGELLIARREGFQRVYDLCERVLPQWDPAHALAPSGIYRQMISSSARVLGVATEAWLRDYYRLRQREARPAIRALVNSGELQLARIEDIPEPAYVHRETLPLLRKIQRGGLKSHRTELLSPFDPVVWDRARGAALFSFDYQIECYTLEHKRQYGYFTLPILHNGALIGRLDPKAHRRDGIFEVKHLHLEPGIQLKRSDWQQLADSINSCAHWHGTPEVVVRTAHPAGAVKMLAAALRT